MKVNVYPPLGATTSIWGDTLHVRMYCSGSVAEVANVGDAEIWTNVEDADEWRAIPLEEIDQSNAEFDLLKNNLSAEKEGARRQFGLDLPVASISARDFEFTFRWRKDIQSEWNWAGGFNENAKIALPKPKSDDMSLTDSLFACVSFETAGMKNPFTYEQNVENMLSASTDRTDIASGTTIVFNPASDNLDKSFKNQKLCFRLQGFQRHLAFVRKDLSWIIPKPGTGTGTIVDNLDIVMIVVEVDCNVYIALMPFVDHPKDPRAAIFKADASNRLFIHSEFGDCTDVPPAERTRLVASISSNPQLALGNLLNAIKNKVPKYKSALSKNSFECATPHIPLSKHLGYCTWSAMYKEVTHDKVVEEITKRKQYSEQNREAIMPDWVLIDDGWQDTTDTYLGQYCLNSIGANTKAFPNQLKDTVSKLKALGIRRVGVWHTLWGSWNGINPEGPLAEEYHPLDCFQHKERFQNKVLGPAVYLISKRHVHQFYDKFYSWLKDQGVSFVKVDNQSAFETLDGLCDISLEYINELRASYQSAMEETALKHFGAGSVIYCMAQSPDTILRTFKKLSTAGSISSNNSSPLKNLPPPMLLRNSDDYFPGVVNSYGWHVYCNMANLLWSRSLTPYFSIDWDMFIPEETDRLHDMSRLMSGGPVYITGSVKDSGVSFKQLNASKIPQRSPPSIDNHSLFVDPTKVQGLLCGSVIAAGGSAINIAVYNVTNNDITAPILVRQLFADALAVDQQHCSQPLIDTPDFTINSNKSVEEKEHQYYLISSDRILTPGHVITQSLNNIYTLNVEPLSGTDITITKLAASPSNDKSCVLLATCTGGSGRYGSIQSVLKATRVFYMGEISSGENSPSEHQPKKKAKITKNTWRVTTQVDGNAEEARLTIFTRDAATYNSSSDHSVNVLSIYINNRAFQNNLCKKGRGEHEICIPLDIETLSNMRVGSQKVSYSQDYDIELKVQA